MTLENQTGYSGILKVTLNTGKSVRVSHYKNSGTKALGTLIGRCLVGETLPRTAYPMYIDIVASGSSCLTSKRGIASPYTIEPTDTQVSTENLIGASRYTVLIRSIDVSLLPSTETEGEIQLLDGEGILLARITASDIVSLLRTIQSDPNYNITLEWTLQIYNI